MAANALYSRPQSPYLERTSFSGVNLQAAVLKDTRNLVRARGIYSVKYATGEVLPDGFKPR